jgi:hypothetical protein
MAVNLSLGIIEVDLEKIANLAKEMDDVYDTKTLTRSLRKDKQITLSDFMM